MPRHSPCALLSLTFMLESSRVVRNCMFTEFSSVTHNNFSHFQYLSILACSRSVFLLFSFQSAILATPSLENSNEFSQSILNSKYCLILCWDSNHLLLKIISFGSVACPERYKRSVRYLYINHDEWFFACLVGLSGLEPPTSRLSGVRSNQLSYKPIAGL